MRPGMDREFVKDPITIRTLTNETSKKCRRGRKTRSFAFQAGGKEIGESCLNLTLDMRRKKGKPNAKRVIVTKSMEGGNESTIVLSMLNDTIPPGREVANGIGVKRRKKLAKLLLSLGVEAAS
jgi:hypothetical protein